MVVLREGTLEDGPLLSRMFCQMWLDIGIAEDGLVEDAERRVIRFIETGQQLHHLRMFFAVKDQEEVGAAVCQHFTGLYPEVLAPEVRRYGYIWGVYVAPEARKVGVGAKLTSRCLDALRGSGCTHALLHAAPMGAGIYERLGFQGTNEMRLSLSDG